MDAEEVKKQILEYIPFLLLEAAAVAKDLPDVARKVTEKGAPPVYFPPVLVLLVYVTSEDVILDESVKRWAVIIDHFEKKITVVRTYEDFANLYYCGHCQTAWAHASFIGVGPKKTFGWNTVEEFLTDAYYLYEDDLLKNYAFTVIVRARK